MTVEQSASPIYLIKRRLEKTVADRIIPRLAADLPRFLDSIHPVYAPDFEKIYREIIADGNKTPILLSGPHGAHTDGLGLAVVVHTLTLAANEAAGHEILKGFILPIAESMRTGNQGAILKEATNDAERFLAEKRLSIPSYTRGKDRKEHGLVSNNIGFMRALVADIQAGNGIAVFPEASVKSGRIKTKPFWDLLLFKRYGMQEFTGVNFDAIKRCVRMAGKEPLYIPISVYGGFNVISPVTRFPTIPFLVESLVTHPTETNLILVNVGLPLTDEEVAQELGENGKAKDPHAINHFLGRKVAALTPPHARGVYR